MRIDNEAISRVNRAFKVNVVPDNEGGERDTESFCNSRKIIPLFNDIDSFLLDR